VCSSDLSATLTWTSVTNRSYYVERATDLAGAAGFSLLQTDIQGLPDRTSFTDTNLTDAARHYYRIGARR
jgi:hypothetical protein